MPGTGDTRPAADSALSRGTHLQECKQLQPAAAAAAERRHDNQIEWDRRREIQYEPAPHEVVGDFLQVGRELRTAGGREGFGEPFFERAEDGVSQQLL